MKPFVFTHKIRTFETDSRGLLTSSSLLNILQYGAGKHADDLGWSVRSLHESGKTWVLQRFYVEIEKLPSDDEAITLTTYPTGAERILAYRDYKVENEAGELLVKATSSWVILDLESRRVVAVPDNVKDISESFGPKITSLPASRITPFDPQNEPDENITHEFRVRRHDLDLNRHVNNVRYMEWAIESVPEAVFENKRLSTLDIVFKAECFYGDTVMSVSRPLPVSSQDDALTGFEHLLYRKSDQKPVCLVHSAWK